MQTAWKTLGNTVRSIAEEAVATAKELREAHNVEAWDDGDGEPGDARRAVPPPAAAPSCPRPQPAPVAIAPSAAQQQPAGSDVASRLAALKAKLQADKARAGGTPSSARASPRGGGASTAPSALPAAMPMPAPAVQTSTSRPAAPQPHPSTADEGAAALHQQLAAALQQLELEQQARQQAAGALHSLQVQLVQDRQELSDALARSQNEAEAHQAAAEYASSETQQLQARLSSERSAMDALRAENERLGAAVAGTASAGSAAASTAATEEVARLEAMAHAARDEVVTQRARVAQLEAEAAELHVQLERAQAAASAGGDADAELAAARAECDALREESEQLRAQAAAANPQLNGHPLSGGTANSEELESLTVQLAVAKAALAAADADRASARQQLSRLKAQMLGEQDEEEEKVRWRVEAEVKLAMDKIKRSGGGDTAGAEGRLRAELDAAAERIEVLQEEAAKWEGAAAARDAELANLQRALGELSYESDAAERLRAELRAQQAEAHSLRNQLDAARLAAMAAEAAQQRAEGEAAAARSEAAAVGEAEAAAQREVLALRVALQDARRRYEAMRGAGAPLERAAVLQALSGVMRVRRPRDAAELAAKALGLSDEEQAEVEAGATLRGPKGGQDSLADKWISFLEDQVGPEAPAEAAVNPTLQPRVEAAAPILQ